MKLYDFQQVAVDQLMQHEEDTDDRSALIGDDMGLGKTVEAIALDLLKRDKFDCKYTAQTLIVTQTSVMGSWEDHYKAWAPDLNVMIIDRKNRQKFVDALTSKVPTDGPAGSLPEYQVFVCHWQVLRFIADDIKAVDWFHVIGDEIQNIKNRKAQQTQVYKKLATYYKTGLSGTWADNKPDDAWSVLNWLWPKTWTSYWSFFNRHVVQKRHEVGTCLADGCGKYHQRAFTETIGLAEADEIHERMGKAYVRRTKEEVAKDLPDKTWDDRMVNLDPKQRGAYNAMRDDMLAWVGTHEDQPIAAPAVISQLIRLQQFAVAYGKMEAKKVYLGLDDDDGVKQYGERAVLILDEPSSKLDAAMDIIEASNGQLVVFGQSKQAINLLAARLKKAGIPTGVLTGDVKQADRDLAVREFQSGSLKVFLSTIKAGGVGITLTAASTCIFLDVAWSPSANRQAEDRLHRLGQKNPVLIIRLVATDTIDRKRNDRIELKWSWLKEILNPKKEM
jgi:SNF2 family DNA or RNA helicase